MNIEQMLSVLNPEIVERLKTAVEIGKWPNGVALTKEQRETCMQAVIAWELKNLPEEQRSGYIDRGTKEEGEVCEDD
ncbi:YeaC family protein, partial [Acinetobacter baumannii]